jgi:hypothetical protein
MPGGHGVPAVVGPERARRQRGMDAGWLGTVGRTWARQRCLSTSCKHRIRFSLISAPKVFDEMPARSKNSNF